MVPLSFIPQLNIFIKPAASNRFVKLQSSTRQRKQRRLTGRTERDRQLRHIQITPFLNMSNNDQHLSQTHQTNCQHASQNWRPVFIWDTETTGLSPSDHRMIEIAAMELPITSPYKTSLTFSSLIYPKDLPAPRSPFRKNGVTNEMMQDAPTFPEVWDAFKEFITDACAHRHKPILVAHNVQFDLAFLQAELARSSLTLPDWDFACSYRDIARSMWPGQPASLHALCERLHVKNEEPHRAISDVKATAEVLANIEKELAGRAVSLGQKQNSKGGNVYYRLLHAANRRRLGIDNKQSKHIADDAENLNSGSETGSTVPNRGFKNKSISSNTFSCFGSESSGSAVKVYYSPKGKLWHSRRDCPKLDLAKAIIQVSFPPKKRLPCFRCVRRGQRALTEWVHNEDNDEVEGHSQISLKGVADMETSSHMVQPDDKSSEDEISKHEFNNAMVDIEQINYSDNRRIKTRKESKDTGTQ